MVLRRAPGSQWTNKISTFLLVIMAGSLYRLNKITSFLFSKNHLKEMTSKDSSFLPDAIK